ncbi:unnamed protein product [Arabidopsis arenosa]|uniref:HMG box domain-containing protein n=1 Tax=Arabidopsis arenosa TaxID=38785 RepID=A0A8S2ALJ1_ARAAE|nr:unnamed protein product [Arabidopsis arenosa]
MAGPSTTSNAPKKRKRVEAETSSTNTSTTLRRAKDVALISMHNCSLDAKIRVNLEAQHNGSLAKDAAKIGGEKWKSLTEDEKKVYLDKAAELKAEYNKSLESNEEEEDEEKQSDDVDDADEAEEKEVEKTDDDNKEAEGKEEEEEEILDDY